jgi:hypothetical protein
MIVPDFACTKQYNCSSIFIKKNVRANSVEEHTEYFIYLFFTVTVSLTRLLLHASKNSIVTSIQSPNIEQKRNSQDAFNSG